MLVLLRDERRTWQDWHSGSVVQVQPLSGDLVVKEEGQKRRHLSDVEARCCEEFLMSSRGFFESEISLRRGWCGQQIDI